MPWNLAKALALLGLKGRHGVRILARETFDALVRGLRGRRGCRIRGLACKLLLHELDEVQVIGSYTVARKDGSLAWAQRLYARVQV